MLGTVNGPCWVQWWAIRWVHHPALCQSVASATHNGHTCDHLCSMALTSPDRGAGRLRWCASCTSTSGSGCSSLRASGAPTNAGCRQRSCGGASLCAPRCGCVDVCGQVQHTLAHSRPSACQRLRRAVAPTVPPDRPTHCAS
eukprot:256304-Chlamydomonas_euryale.AAC.1